MRFDYRAPTELFQNLPVSSLYNGYRTSGELLTPKVYPGQPNIVQRRFKRLSHWREGKRALPVPSNLTERILARYHPDIQKSHYDR